MIVTPIPTRRTIAGVATILIAAGLIHLLDSKPLGGAGVSGAPQQAVPEPVVKASALDDLITAHAEHPIPATAAIAAGSVVTSIDDDPEWRTFRRSKEHLPSMLGSCTTWPGLLYRHVVLNPGDVYIPKIYRDMFDQLWKMHDERIREVGRILLYAEIADMDEQIAAGNYWIEEGFHYGEYPPGMTPPPKDPSDTRKPWYLSGGRQPTSEHGIGCRIVDGKMLSVDGVNMNRSKPAAQYWKHLYDTQAGDTIAWFSAMGCLNGTKASELIADYLEYHRFKKQSPSSVPTNANQEPRK